MKRINLMLLFSLLIVSCEKGKDIERDVNFGVRLAADNSYVVGEELTFDFSGDAAYILFYSGEDGACYQNEDGTSGESLAIKSLTTEIESYSYTYTETGEYRATFVATEASIYGSSRVVESVTFTIVEQSIDPEPEPEPDPDPDAEADTEADGTLEDVTGSNDDIFAQDPSSAPSHDGTLGDVTGSNDDIFN